MASYKVIQDIEAEDKLLGPLSLRQFIYAVIVVVLGFISYEIVTHVQPLLAFPLIPPMILFAVLAAPFGHDQSSEIWLLAKIRFFLKPRARVWNQVGLQELVKITVPKKIERVLTNNLDQTQVKSRLEALAQTIDTRGWATKGVSVNLSTNPAAAVTNQSTDRLLSPAAVAAPTVPDLDVTAKDDMLDIQNNPVAAQMSELVKANDQAHRQAILNNMQQLSNAPAASKDSDPAPAATHIATSTPIATSNTFDDSQLIKPTQFGDGDGQLVHHPGQMSSYGATAVLKPDSPKHRSEPKTKPDMASVTAKPKPAILDLASNDDLSVATIARQANKANSDGEVVISLR